jgi:hypothetical protein
LSCVLFFLNLLSLSALTIETTLLESLRCAAVILKYWPIIEIAEMGKVSNRVLAVAFDFLDHLIALQIQYLKVRHFCENFLHTSFVVDQVIGELNTFEGRAI